MSRRLRKSAKISFFVILGMTCCFKYFLISLNYLFCFHFKDKLYDGFQRKCCGENLIDELKVCCRDNKEGSSYTYSTGYQCCNTEYVDNATSLCCTADTGHQKVNIEFYFMETDPFIFFK